MHLHSFIYSYISQSSSDTRKVGLVDESFWLAIFYGFSSILRVVRIHYMTHTRTQCNFALLTLQRLATLISEWELRTMVRTKKVQKKLKNSTLMLSLFKWSSSKPFWGSLVRMTSFLFSLRLVEEHNTLLSFRFCLEVKCRKCEMIATYSRSFG